jgi:hypothetical protein
MLLKPWLLHEKRQIVLVSLWHPAIAVPNEPQEIGSGSINFRQTYRQNFTAFGLFRRDAPPQVDVYHFHTALAGATT